MNIHEITTPNVIMMTFGRNIQKTLE